MPKPSNRLLYASLAALVLIWGTTWAAIRIGLEGVPPFTGASIRFGVSTLLLVGIASVLRVPLGRRPRERRVWLANGILLFCVSYGVVYWAEQWVPSGLAAILFATFPLFVVIQAHFLLPGERLTRRILAGVLVAFAGVAAIYSEDFDLLGGPKVALASVVFLLSPISAGLGNVLVKKWGEDIHPVSVTLVPMAMGAIVLGTIGGLTEHDIAMRFDARTVGSILYLAFFGTAVTFGLYFWLLTHFPATKLALIAYGTPVVAVTLGSVLLHEPITVRVVLGSAAVIVGVAVVSRSGQGVESPSGVGRSRPGDGQPPPGSGAPG